MELKTLKFKYVFILCIIVFCYLIFRGNHFYNQITNVYFEKEEIKFTEKVETYTTFINSEEKMTDLLFSHEAIKRFVLNQTAENENKMMSVFNNFVLDDNIYNNIWIADKNGKVIFDMRKQITGMEISERTYFLESKINTQAKISGELINAKSTGITILPICEGIFINGKYEGMIGLSLTWDTIHHKYIEPLENREEKGYFTIYNLKTNKSMYPITSILDDFVRSKKYKKTNVYENYLIFNKESGDYVYLYFIDKDFVYKRVAIQTTILIIFVIITIIILSYMYGLYIEKKLRGEV